MTVKSNKNLDAFLEELSEKLELRTNQYQFSKLEQLRYEYFRWKHQVCPGAISVVFTPTGIGTAVTLTCNGCSCSEEITDTSSW